MEKSINPRYELPLVGLHNVQDALQVDSLLSKIGTLDSHSVDFAQKKAVITLKNGEYDFREMVKSIRGLGFDLTVQKKTFPVLHMSCASCASSSQSMIEHQPGVINAQVNYANGIATVEYIPSVIGPEAFKSALQTIGYDLMIEETEDAKSELEALHKKDSETLLKKTIAASVLSVPTIIIGMFFMEMPYANYILWALSTPVVAIIGRQFFINAWKQAKHGSASMDTLVALSTGVAYSFSVFNTLFPEYWHQRGLHGHVYFEAASVVIAFILLGKLLEENAKGNTTQAIKKLMGLQPQTATLMDSDGKPKSIPLGQITVGDLLLVRPGEKLGVDGMVITGSSYVDESMINGEPIPLEKNPGDTVFAGTINQKGSFQFVATKVGRETLLAQIIQQVEDAQGSKAPVQKMVDSIASIFVPVVMGISLLTLLLWIILGGNDGFSHGLLAMVTVLVIACPCSLGLATPTAIMVGVGKGAEAGILIKDAESLETAQHIQAVVLDKTGTITEGKPKVHQMEWGNNDPSLVSILASIERASEHPLAEAVVAHVGEVQGVTLEKFESITGMGVKAVVGNRTYFVGNDRLLRENHIQLSPTLEKQSQLWNSDANTVVYFTNETEVLAVIAIADKIKPRSIEAIQTLKSKGIDVYMLTGDSTASATHIASKAGITHFKAEVLPHQKAEFIKELQGQGKIVAMVGDGINDSNALAQADVSIAMGKGSDIAMDVAKMTIISSDLTKIPQAILLSKYTVATIRQNLFWAFIYNLIGIPIAAGILYPINGFLLNPMIAGAAMALSSVSVVSNSLRLKFKSLK